MKKLAAAASPAGGVVTAPPAAEVLALDLLRGAAALVVFLGHIRAGGLAEYEALPVEHQGPLTAAVLGFVGLGHEAVLVFFVLSGFLVGGPLIRRTRDGTADLRAYATDRITRIFIPLLPACCLTLALDALVLGQPLNLLHVLGNAVGLNGTLVPTLPSNPPLWTLAYEIWFYVAAGAAAYLVSTRHAAVLAFGALAAAAVVFSVLEARYLVFWSLGAFAPLLLIRRRGLYALGFLGALVAGLAVIASQLSVWTKQPLFAPPAAFEAAICGGVALMLPMCCDARINAALAPFRRPILYFAGLSYTLYLTHFPINQALGRIFPTVPDLSLGSLGLLALRAVLVVLAAHLMFLMFEARTGTVRRCVKERWLARAPGGVRTSS